MKRTDILIEIKHNAEIVTNNLIKLFVLDVDTDKVESWVDEVWSRFHRLRKSEVTIKRQDMLVEILLWSDFGELKDRLVYIVRHNSNFNLKEASVDLTILHSQISNYFTWLLDRLYDDGTVSILQVKEAVSLFGSKE